MRGIQRAAFGVAVVAAFGLLVPVARAATVEVVDGTAVFTAASGEVNDVLAGSRSGGKFIDLGAPLTAGTGCEQLDASSALCPGLSASSPIVIRAGDGDDRAVVNDNAGARPSVTITGGSGNDVLRVSNGLASSPMIDGGRGDDTLTANLNVGGTPVMHGGPGNDSVGVVGDGGDGLLYGDQGDDDLFNRGQYAEPLLFEGGAGDDRYTFARTGGNNDVSVLVPGPGADTLDLSSAPGFVGPQIDLAACSGCVEVVIGSPRGDQITGSAWREIIHGGDGNDVLDGGGGQDLIAGQDGDDAITSRDDVFDTVSCEVGTDAVVADLFDLVSADCETVSRLAAQEL